MAVPTPSVPVPAGPGPGCTPLLDHAVRLLLDHARAAGPADRAWRFGPLVIVSGGDRAAAAAVSDGLGRGGTAGGTIVRDGRALDREIGAALAGDRLARLSAALEACRLVVVDRIDRVAAGPRRDALVHLFDASTGAGAAWCVSTAGLRDDELGAGVASRLAGGLVVAAPMTHAVAPGVTPQIGRVLRAAARHHDVPVAALVGPQRNRTVSAARSLAMYLARRLTGLSFQAIGAACGGRDHTTVLHGTRVCGSRIARDAAYAADVERIVAELAAAGGGATRRRPAVGSATLARALASRRRGRRRRA